MARISTHEVSNFDQSKELSLVTSQGKPVHWPPLHRSAPAFVVSQVGGEELSAGTSSSKSEEKQDKSGVSARDTASSPQSHAQDVASRSGKDPPTKAARSSSASTTAGSTQETGRSQQSRSSSSGALTEQTGVIQGQPSPKVTRAKSQKQGDS